MKVEAAGRDRARARGLVALAVMLSFPVEAMAHGGEQDPWRTLAWSFEPGVIVPLVLTAWLYARGVRRLWAATSSGRGIRWTDVSCYSLGWLTLVVALVSPLHPLGGVLFSAHMTQHELLMLVAAPLLVLGRPLIALLWALPRGWGRRLSRWAKVRWWQRSWGVLTNGFVAWGLHAVVLWLWHIPGLFQATLHNGFVHALQHVSFLGSALLFWWAVMHGRQRMAGYGVAVLYLFTTALHSGLLGALLTFSNSVWYPAYLATTGAWDLTALEDQQLGGLVMWIPAGLVYIIAGLAFFAGWLRESEGRALHSGTARQSGANGDLRPAERSPKP